jgi:hypothetical protein
MAEKQSEREGGRQMGGGPGEADMAAPGGSSGTGGYGNAQDRQDRGEDEGAREPGQSRGERFDELAGGGRDADSVSLDEDRDGGRAAADDEV